MRHMAAPEFEDRDGPVVAAAVADVPPGAQEQQEKTAESIDHGPTTAYGRHLAKFRLFTRTRVMPTNTIHSDLDNLKDVHAVQDPEKLRENHQLAVLHVHLKRCAEHFASLEVQDESEAEMLAGLKMLQHTSAHHVFDVTAPTLDAFALTHRELIQEMEARGLKPVGFFADDARVLQKIYAEERDVYVRTEKERRQKDWIDRRRKKKAGERAKIMARNLREELMELKADPMVRRLFAAVANDDLGSEQLRLAIKPQLARTLGKALWTSTLLRRLDLSHNELDDKNGSYIARALKNNQGLVCLDLAGNLLGQQFVEVLAGSLEHNRTLQALNLEDNPLVPRPQPDEDELEERANDYWRHELRNSGKPGRGGEPVMRQASMAVLHDMALRGAKVKALGKLIETTNALTSLNLVRTGIDRASGEHLAAAAQMNPRLLILEVARNDLSQAATAAIAQRLRENRAEHTLDLEIQAAHERREAAERAAELAEQAERRQAAANEAWLHRRIEERAAQRKADEIADLKAKREAREAREEKEALRRKKAAELAAKKKKKKGKKGKGKAK